MIKQYLKQAFRLLSENKLLSIISILGTALAICMIMVIVILYVVKTAGFSPEVNRDRTYYYSAVKSLSKDDGRRISYASIGYPLLRECLYPLESAEVVTAVIRNDMDKQMATTTDNLNNYSSTVMLTDTAFWKLFAFDFTAGVPFSAASFTSGLCEAVISESVARRLFGTTEAVGREMKLNFVTFRVCGVVKDVSRFADKAFADIWVPYTFVKNYADSASEGIIGGYQCYALLKEGATQEELQQETLHRVDAFNQGLTGVKADFGFQPRSQVEEWLGGGNEGRTDTVGLYARYGVILFVLLLVPALNLSGITLSRMRRRRAELGVRRAFGATQGNLVAQVLLENMGLTLLGGVLGLLLSALAMLLLGDWLLITSMGEAGLSGGMFNGAVFVAAFFFCLLMNLMSAGLPAWHISQTPITDTING